MSTSIHSHPSTVRVTVSIDDEAGQVTIDDCTQRTPEVLGYDTADLVGKPVTEVYAQTSDAESPESVSRVVLQTADGTEIPAVVGAEDDEDDGVTLTFIPDPPGSTADDHDTASGEPPFVREADRHRDEVYDALTDFERRPDDAITRALEIAAEFLGLSVGFVTEISDGEQQITHVAGSDGTLTVGERYPLEDAYCRETIERDGLLCATSVEDTAVVRDAAYDRFKFGSYVGKRLVVDGELYGTVCFADPAPRDTEFSLTERLFVESVASLIGQRLERERAHHEVGRYERRMAAERRRLTQFFEDGPFLFLQTRLVDGTIVVDHCNDRFAARLGYSVDEVIGQPLTRFYVDESTRRLEDHGYDEALDGSLTPSERRLLAADGEVVPTVMHADSRGPRATNSLDDAIGTNAVYVDVSEARRQAEMVASQRRKLDLVLEETRTGIAEWNLRTDEMTFDATLRRLLGADPDSIEEFTECVHPADRERVQEAIEQVLETNEVVTAEYRVLSDVDESTWVNARATTLKENGEPVRLVAIINDISQEREQRLESRRIRERVRVFTDNVEEYAFFVVDERGEVDTWNTGAARLFGYDESTAEAASLGKILQPDDETPDLADRLREQADLSGGSSYTGWLCRRDGTTFYADVRVIPTVLGTDGGQQYTVITHDMTAQQREKRRAERFVQESVDIVAVLSPDGEFEYCSGSISNVLGYYPEELVGQNVFDYVHPDDRKQVMEAFFTVVEEADERSAVDFRFRDGDGEWRTLDGRGRNLLDDDAIDGILVYARDVTENRQRQRRYEAVFNQTYQLTGLLDVDGRWLEINETAQRVGEVDREGVVGRPLWETPWWRFDPDERAAIEEAVERAAAGEVVQRETEIVGRDGLRVLDFSIKPLTNDDGTVVLLVPEGRDITGARRGRQHARVLQRVLRHNIRNDVGKLRGYADLLAEADDGESRARYMAVIDRVLEKWEGISEHAVKIQSIVERQEQEEDVVEVSSLVAAVAETATDRHPTASITTSVGASCADDLPVTVETALTELVDNAVAASESSEPTVEISAAKPQERSTVLRVVDDGPGMPETEQQVLEDGEETPLNHGESLGLWLVRSIVVQAGGWFSVDVDETGTTVTIFIPDDPERAVPQVSLDD